ncbi:SDR family NAD(P)-dependent oxidoreductase, partial [bacterium]|nr:SDR family NAD(P)-dependent oxidoreductase [bacterium]
MRNIDKEKIRTWFITGASSGVGYALATELLNRGYNVVAVSRRVPNIEHKNALCLSVDVTKPETIKSAMNKGIEKFGKIDVLSNNAGISANIIFEDETIEHMKEVMETNYWGAYNTMKEFVPYFRKNKNGTIINNTSQSGLTPRSMGSAYCSSKYALEGLNSVVWFETKSFCRVMAFELGGFQQTNVFKSMEQKNTEITEYKNLPNTYIKFYMTFKNQLDRAIPLIINQIEKEKLPRRLILGKDAYIKVKAEIAWLKKDLRFSKKRALKCAKFDKEFPQ